MATAAQMTLWCLPVILLQLSAIRVVRHQPQAHHASGERDATTTLAPEPPATTTSLVNPDECSVSQWVIDAARNTFNAALQVALLLMDPWQDVIKNISLEQDLWACLFKVNATADLQVAGLSQSGVSDFTCLQSTCLDEGYVCNTYQHSISATVDVGVLNISGRDSSEWECGYQIPRTDFNFSTELHNYGIKLEFVLNQTILPPHIAVTKVTSVDTLLGDAKNNECALNGVDLSWLCGPHLEMITRVVQDALKGPIDSIILSLINMILPGDTHAL